MSLRFLAQHQLNPQLHSSAEVYELQRTLHASLQQLLELAHLLHDFGEQNRLCSQQLQLTAGITSKVLRPS